MNRGRKLSIAAVFGWTAAVTALRGTRLPNDFSKAHWLIDYRFGFVKRGLVGSLVSIARDLFRIRHVAGFIDAVSVGLFIVFLIVLVAVGLRTVHRARWSAAAVIAMLAFLSSPFVVMSAHLIGYFDNIVVMLTTASVVLLLNERRWAACTLQAVGILVHETSFLIGLPIFIVAYRFDHERRERRAAEPALWASPLLLPVGAFAAAIVARGLASPDIESLLTQHLATAFPWVHVQTTLVPHWVTITFTDSYRLHRGLVAPRLLSSGMLGLVWPTVVALLSLVIEAYEIPALSIDTASLVAVCLLPQTMHFVAFDTSRIWTYAILSAFLVTWVYSEFREPIGERLQLVSLLAIAAVVFNALELTPLMDGRQDRLDLTTRILLYAPVVVSAFDFMIFEARRRKPALDAVSAGRP